MRRDNRLISKFMKLKLKKKAPNFKLPSTSGKIFELRKVKKNIVIYIYPKKKETLVIGISKDSIESHLKFQSKYKLKFDLLSDEKLSVIKKYGAWGKKTFLGKKYMGVIRSTFLITSKGIIYKIWSNVRVKDHANEVLAELKKIA